MALQLVQHLSIKTTKYNKSTAEYFYDYGGKMESKNNNTLLTNNETSIVNGWNTAYGKTEIRPAKNKQYCWVFAIRQHHSDLKYGAIAIGIEENQGKTYESTYFHGQKESKHYAFTSDGKRYSHLYSKGKRFSDKYNATNSLVMMLIDGFTLSFCKVSQEFVQRTKINSIEQYIEYGAWIVAAEDIGRSEYRMAVSLYGKTKAFGDEASNQSSIELLKYAWIVKEDVDDTSDQDDDEDNDPMYEHKQNGFNDNSLKNAIESLSNHIRHFEKKYDQKALSMKAAKNSKYLDVMEDINKLKQQLNSMNQHVQGMEDYISSVMVPDITRYKTWDIPQMLQWISSLDGGKYDKYLSVFQKGFQSDGIVSGEYLCDLTADNLRSAPFKIKSFPDRNKLAQHFATLRNGNVHYNAYAQHSYH